MSAMTAIEVLAREVDRLRAENNRLRSIAGMVVDDGMAACRDLEDESQVSESLQRQVRERDLRIGELVEELANLRRSRALDRARTDPDPEDREQAEAIQAEQVRLHLSDGSTARVSGDPLYTMSEESQDALRKLAEAGKASISEDTLDAIQASILDCRKAMDAPNSETLLEAVQRVVAERDGLQARVSDLSLRVPEVHFEPDRTEVRTGEVNRTLIARFDSYSLLVYGRMRPADTVWGDLTDMEKAIDRAAGYWPEVE